ncbi:MAG: GGDEF domain-containing protein [Elusimicrobia bacterium]|nr:GGDEF domain-containing protein [Elusimicrobiota bacterium]
MENDSKLIGLYLNLDQKLVAIYNMLSGKKKYPLYARNMWQGLEEDEEEHVNYWQYLRKYNYDLDILTEKESRGYIKKLGELLMRADGLLDSARAGGIPLEQSFDSTVRIEFGTLVSPIYKVLHNHDIIFNSKVFNPRKEYDAHLKRITDAAKKIYHGDSIKRSLMNTYLSVKEERDRMARDAVNDPLTGLSNRRYLRNNGSFLMEIASREKKPLALVMIDVNKFKAINDRFGHPAGDRVLRKIGGILRENTRSSDMAIRYGGDEFAVLLFNQDAKKAGEFVLRLKKETSGARIIYRKNRYMNVTVSAGYSIYDPEKRPVLKKLVSAADAKMYEDKKKSV